MALVGTLVLDRLHVDFGVAGVASPQCGKSGSGYSPGASGNDWPHRIMFVVR
jgi:hypothetical protein